MHSKVFYLDGSEGCQGWPESLLWAINFPSLRRVQKMALCNPEVAMGTGKPFILAQFPGKPTGYRHHSVQFDAFYLAEFCHQGYCIELLKS